MQDQTLRGNMGTTEALGTTGTIAGSADRSAIGGDAAQYDIKILNGLIATTLDSAHGYAEAIRDQEEGSFLELFRTQAQERAGIVTMLQDQVRALGGTPEDDGTALAGVHRLFTRLQAASTKHDDALVNRVEAGEDHIKGKFEEAMNDDQVSPTTMGVIAQAYDSIKIGHDQMSQIKTMLAAS